MTSLYDLLGAHEGDDADALKKAFRKAVKAFHPDLHPGDPDAPDRFRQVIAANALLRDAKQRATYDRVLLLERKQSQLRLECHDLQSKLERQQHRLKRMRTTAAIAAVGALISGYGLFSSMSTTAIVAIQKKDHAAATVPTVKKGRQTAATVETIRNDDHVATVGVAAKQNENTTPPPYPPPQAGEGREGGSIKAEAAGGDIDAPAGSVETTGAQLMAPIDPPDRSEPRDKHDDAVVPDGASKPDADAPAINRGDSPVIAGSELGAAPADMPVLQAAPAPPVNDPGFYRERGIASYRGGDFQGAIGNLGEAIRLKPNDAQSYHIRGNVWDELGVFERALADYDEAIRISPDSPAVFHDRAILWQRKGALDKALVDLDRAVRFSFADANIYCDRGLVWYLRGRHDRAIADFDRAMKLDPNFTVAYINRGLILHSNREFTVAFADSKAIRVDPQIFDTAKRANSRP
jgi:tetratricopeptide (TPR) repeat protein